MPTIGSYALLLALALSFYAFFAGVLALLRPGTRQSAWLGETARRAGIATFLAASVSAVALVISAFRNDFSVAYIMRHSNIDLPAPYKFSVLWSGQEGSLLFWAWLLSSFGFVLLIRHRVDPRLVAHAGVIMAAVQVFFYAMVNFAANPFSLVAGTPPADGNGLNPLLQYPEMVIHPPMLYLGYVGFTVPFAFALGALIMRYPGEKWIHITRRWTMVTWGFLTIGIFLGSHWAYSVLGWGGYWAWDPVENASFLPWLTGTAFLHSVMMQEKRGMMKIWNVWLIFCTFLLCILGTFLTRSGVVSSVHAFAQSGIGPWFIWFLAVTFAVCMFFFLKNKDHLKSEHKLESLVSRESSFLFNNLVLLVACFAVMWGTLFPIISEWVQGTKVTVGPPFFNKIMIPVGLILMMLTAVGPLLAWRKTSLDSVKRNFTIPALVTVASVVAAMALGVRPWHSLEDFYALMTIGLSVLVIATVLSEFVRGGRVIAGHTGQNLLSAMLYLTGRNTRRYGGYIVHFGVALIMIGFAGAAFNLENEQEMGYGSKMEIGRYTLVSRSYTQDYNPNYTNESAIIDVYIGGKFVETMYPEKRTYTSSGQTGTMVANRSTMREDLYLVFAGKNPENNQAIIKAHVNPLVVWIWIGLVVTVFGTGVALAPNRAAISIRKTVPARVPVTAAQQAGD